MHIRPYQPSDRAAIREIAADTADAGRPVENIFPDRELFCDLMTAYYTDCEPGACWVAEEDSRVIGYLTGCLRPAQYRQVMAWRIAPRAAWRIVRNATLLRFIASQVSAWLRAGLRAAPRDPQPQAHLHINVRDGFRGLDAGGHLVSAFIEQARAAGVKSIRASTRADNAGACRFFERWGFVNRGERPLLRVAGRDVPSRVYVLAL